MRRVGIRRPPEVNRVVVAAERRPYRGHRFFLSAARIGHAAALASKTDLSGGPVRVVFTSPPHSSWICPPTGLQVNERRPIRRSIISHFRPRLLRGHLSELRAAQD